MSKLNDSTLKIFKKYRLDTDMSVFGNENKLYDVVKVMDDMVGNQVGNYIAQLTYWDSTKTKIDELYYYSTVSNPIYKRYTSSINVSIKPDFEYCYCLDPLSLKLVQNNANFVDKFLVGFCYNYINDEIQIVAYIGLIPNGSVFDYALFADINMETELTSETMPDGFFSSLFIFVSDKKFSANLSALSYTFFVETKTDYQHRYNYQRTTGLIYIPSYITKSFYTIIGSSGYLDDYSQVVKGEII